MTIYKNPYVSYTQYFVKTGIGSHGKYKPTFIKGYAVENCTGKWTCRSVLFDDTAIREEFPVMAENHVSIQNVIEQAVINAVLQLVKKEKAPAVHESWEDLR